MNYSKITLGELLSSENDTIKRNAVSVLKQLQKRLECPKCGNKIEYHNGFLSCIECGYSDGVNIHRLTIK